MTNHRYWGLMFASLVAGCATNEVVTNDTTQATTPVGAAAVTRANAHLGDTELEIKWGGEEAKIETDVQIFVQQVTLQPGGDTGWHSHNGPVCVEIVSGEFTLYESTDPCAGTTY